MNPRSTTRSKPQSLRIRMKEEARAAILDAAEQVLAEQGIHAARMDDIAARVGVSVGTLYNYFEDRKQLLAALLEVRGRELLAMLDTELERSQGEPYRARLHGFLRCIAEHSRAHFQLFTLLLEDVLKHGLTSGEDVSREQERSLELTRRIERLTQQGVEEGALRPEDACLYPTLLLGMLRAALVRQFLDKRPVPVDELIPSLLRCFLDGAAPRPG
jgi:AcrR family transcriptional regulator